MTAATEDLTAGRKSGMVVLPQHRREEMTPLYTPREIEVLENADRIRLISLVDGRTVSVDRFQRVSPYGIVESMAEIIKFVNIELVMYGKMAPALVHVRIYAGAVIDGEIRLASIPRNFTPEQMR